MRLAGTGKEGQTVTNIQTDLIEKLRSRVRGEVLLPGDPGYDGARSIWNAMIDRRPAVIARCAGVADVRDSLALARGEGMEVSIHGGGHNIAGNAVCDGGLMLDLSPMKSVRVNPKMRRAWVEPGARLGDLDRETEAFGLATVSGINSTTGIAGLTLGGGFGWLTRKHGMTVDSLVSAEMTTAGGEWVRASEDENADLFWALRGGGGNFGIVTSFEFQLHPIGPEVLAGLIVYPFEQAKQVLTRHRELAKGMPEDMNVFAVLRQAPPLPFLSEDVHGKEVIVMAVFWGGDVEAGERAIAPLRDFGTPCGEHVGPQAYTAWQQVFDPLLAPRARNYWKSHNLAALSDGTIDTIIEYAGRLPSMHSEILVGMLDGQASRVSPEATAYSHRDARFVLNFHGRWERPEDDERCIAWAREFYQATAPYGTGGVYVNFMTEDETDRVPAAFGRSYARLVEVKNRYDPTNFFHLNQNVKPSV
jgi:FAD/FMN-containing dehydrogenase